MLVNAFSEVFEYFSEKVGILFSLGIEKEPMSCEFPHNFIGSAVRLRMIFSLSNKTEFNYVVSVFDFLLLIILTTVKAIKIASANKINISKNK